MGKLITAGLLALLVVTLALAMYFDPAAQERREMNNFYERQRQELELERQRQQAELWATWAPVWAAALNIAGITALFMVLAGLAALGVAAGARFRRDLRVFRPDQRGLLPYPATGDLAAASTASLAGYHAARLAEASRVNLPAQLTYSPHYNHRAEAANRSSDGPPALTTGGPPSFAELLANQQIGQGQPLLLGWGPQGAVTGAWRSLYSTGLGGLQGSGKTWTAACLLAQSALNGARLLVIDPHAGDSESLATRIAPLAPAYLAEPASDEREIVSALELARAEFQRRKSGRPDRWALVVAVDEWTALLRHELREILPLFVADLATEGRKFNVHCMLLGQRWAAVDSGGGGVRNVLTSHYVHRTRRDEARMQLGLGTATPTDTHSLAPGEAYLLNTAGTLQRVRMPMMTGADLERVGALLRENHPADIAESSAKHPVALPENPAAERLEKRSAEDVRIVQMFLAGYDAAAIVTELTGMKSRAGAPYQQRLREVQAVIRIALQSATG